MLLGNSSLIAANDSRVETHGSILSAERSFKSAGYAALSSDAANNLRERSASSNQPYSSPIGGGSSPAGLGFTFGDSWTRTQRGIMEFSQPTDQHGIMTMSMRFAYENAFVAKALRMKTIFTTKGVTNNGPDDNANQFFDQVHKQLHLQAIFKKAVWLYYAVGVVPIIMPDPGEPLDWLEILDPRMVRITTAYGKTMMSVIPDQRLRAAAADPKGTSSKVNAFIWNAIPASWKLQLAVHQSTGDSNGQIILKDGSYILIDNRLNVVGRDPNAFDGVPLQPYLAACEQYRMLAAGDFATAFLTKNIITLVSVGDPKAEGPDLYLRPDANTLAGLQSSLSNPNQAQTLYVDPTMNIRYITPSPEALSNAKYNEPKEVLKNLLPSPFWYNDGTGSFASATLQMKELEEECNSCQDAFDEKFWTPIHERAVTSTSRISSKNASRPPTYDVGALSDKALHLKQMNEIYNNGGLSIRSLQESHGIDPDTEYERLKAQMSDVKKGIYMPAFESKQGLLTAKLFGTQKLLGKKSGDGGEGGRPQVDSSRPTAETVTTRAPRPSSGK